VLDRAVEGVDREAISRLLLGPGAEVHRYVDISSMDRALASSCREPPISGEIRHHELWRLAMTEVWMRWLADPCSTEDASALEVRPDVHVG
jgi:hypothetical protein